MSNILGLISLVVEMPSTENAV
jgi:hypothetical protein